MLIQGLQMLAVGAATFLGIVLPAIVIDVVRARRLHRARAEAEKSRRPEFSQPTNRTPNP